MKHNGSFETPEGGYGGEYELPDGTPVNVVTVWTGPGIACDTEFEADRPLTTEEIEAAGDEDTNHNHADEPQIPYTQRPVQHRY